MEIMSSYAPRLIEAPRVGDIQVMAPPRPKPRLNHTLDANPSPGLARLQVRLRLALKMGWLRVSGMGFRIMMKEVWSFGAAPSEYDSEA